jgi:hypothetical protein
MQDLVQRLRDRAYSFKAHDPLVEEAAAEIARLREAIRRLAEHDATLSVCGGAVTVTMDATLTDAERQAIMRAMYRAVGVDSAVLGSLLERTK